MKTCYNIFLIISTLLFSKYQLGQDCHTLDKTDEEMESLPWYGNNEFLYNLLDSIGYDEFLEVKPGRSESVYEVPVSMFKIPIQFWIYCDASGNNNGMDEAFVQARLDELNILFFNSNTLIQFYKTCDIFYVNNNTYLNPNENQQKDMIRDNFMSGVVNVHFVRSLSGSSGVHWSLLTKAGIILNQSNLSSSTFAHEIGHHLGLDHTHQYSNSTKRRQEAVSRSRNFTFIETLLYSKSGKICDKNGDALCDTPADPNIGDGSIVSTPPSCGYTDVSLQDLWGDYYYTNSPDTRNIMSYNYYRVCRNDFSQGQRGVMIYKALNRGYGNSYLHPIERYFFDKYEPDNTSSTARTILLNTVQHHTFHWSNEGDNEVRSCDEDWMKFNISSSAIGKLIQIYTDEGHYTNADTEVWVYRDMGSSGLVNIGYDDNSNGNGFSSVILKNLAIGMYYIKVKYKTLPPFNGVIDYTIKIRECVPTNPCLKGTVENSESKIYYGFQNLTAPCSSFTFKVKSGGNAVMISDQVITLNPGFEVEVGADFETYVTPIGEEACFNNELRKSKVQSDSPFPAIAVIGKLEKYLNKANLERVEGETSIADNSSTYSKLKIFPNPNDGNFRIELSSELKNISKIQIIDEQGKIVMESNRLENNLLNIHNPKPGLYCLVLTTDTDVEVEKFIIK